MFGLSSKDLINSWLQGAKEGREMSINDPDIKDMIQKEISETKEFADRRIGELESLLNDKRYFPN